MMNFDKVLFNGWQYVAIALIAVNLASLFPFSYKKIKNREEASKALNATAITSVIAWIGAIPLILSQQYSEYVIIFTIFVGVVSAAKYFGVAALGAASGGGLFIAPFLLALAHKPAIVIASILIAIQAGLALVVT